MASELNKSYFTGIVVGDLSIDLTAKSSKQVGNLTVALKASRGRKLFVDVTIWGEAANIVPYLNKGDEVLIEGRMDLDCRDDKKFIITAEHLKVVRSELLNKIGRTNEDLEQLVAQEEVKKL